MNTPRNHQTATMLSNGQLLIAGGINGSSVSSSAELYGYNLNSGLVAYYPFTGDANDASGNGNNGIVYSATLTTDRFGNANAAYNFNGTNSYIDIPQSAGLNLTTNFTLSAWIDQMTVRPLDGSRILDKDTPGLTDGWSFDTWDGVTGHKLRLQGAVYNGYNTVGATVYSLMQWHHVVATVSGTIGKVYLDGILDGTGNEGNIPANSLDIFIGRAHPNGGLENYVWFNGIIDNVRIYNRAFSDSEVQALYAFENSNQKSVIFANIQSSSTLTVTPASAPANGQSNVTATVTLLNGVNNPVPGRMVKFMSSRNADVIPQPKSVTDANGQATATISSTTPGTSTISVSDLTDGVVVQQQPTVQFTSGTVPLDPSLSNAIVQLANTSSNLLTTSIAGFAIGDGGYGDYFQNIIPSEKRNLGVSDLSTGLSGLMSLLLKGTDDPFLDVVKSIGFNIAESHTSEILDIIVGNSAGLTLTAQQIVGNNGNSQQSESMSERGLLAGVLPISATYTSSYTNDIALRIGADLILSNIVSSQNQDLMGFYNDSLVAHGNNDILEAFFTGVDYLTTFAGTLVAAPKVLGAASGLVSSLSTRPASQYALNIDQQAYNSATICLLNASYLSGLVDANTKAAFNNISNGQQPHPVTGQILNVSSAITYTPVTGLFGDLSTWVGFILNTKYVNVTGAYSLVTVSNSNSQAETFCVNAFYEHVATVNNMFGVSTEGTAFPMVSSVTASIAPYQSKQFQITYYDGVNGATPDSLPISISVLGYDSNNGIYAVDQTTSTIQWQSVNGAISGAVSNAKFKSNGATPATPSGNTSTNLYAFINPIKTFVAQNPSNQTYQAQIWVANPFAIPLLATVTQPLSSGITVLSTDGMLGSSSIVWTNIISTNGLFEETFTFSMPTTPGAQTNLPVAGVVFTDGTGTNSMSLQSLVANFKGLFPVSVNGYIPQGISGSDAPMQLTVTNWTGTNLTGLLTVSLADQTGTQVANFSQSFIVSGSSGTNLIFALPGTLPPGTYSVTGSLVMYGGSEQILTGLYVVPLAPVILGFSSTPPLTNGINMMLQGPIGSNYLVEASSDLVNWTPILNFYATNSPFYFSDPTAANYNQRFYRAVLFDGASVASTNTPSLVFGSSQPLTASGFQLKVTAPISSTCVIQASTNLVSWQTLSQFVVQNATVYFTDPQATNFSQRFYRVLTQ